jgi:fumarate reductase flavoprotein subunit
MSQREAPKNKSLEAQIVVIGGGGAGLPAALTAVEEGARGVIVLEKRFATGGDALRANWIFAVESRLQKEAGVTITADDIYKKALEWHRYDRVKPRILRTLIRKTADTVRWLEEKGVEFELRAGPGPISDLRGATGHWVKGAPFPDTLCSFGIVYRLLTQKCKDGGVQFLFRTSGKKILRGADGKVTGVLAVTRGGQEIEIKTRSVILCPGSFNGNKELLKKYFPYYYDENVYVTDALLSNTGDGLQMAADAGAAMEDFCTLIRHGYSFETTVNNRCHGAGQPTGIRVNKRGQRYLAESMQDTSGNTLIQQPGKIAYILYDDKIVQGIVDRADPPQWSRVPPPPDKIPDFRQYVQKAAKQGVWAKISDTWDGIANWIGADPKVLKATVDRYNSFCDRGYDEDFAKEKQYLVPLRTPPYYAIKVQPLMIETIGPVRVNERMEVLDKQDNPIPGFYAAGVITSGWESYDYGGTPPATALGFSIASGRIAAENAAKFVLGK